MKNKYVIEGNDVIMDLNLRSGEVIKTVFDISDFENVKSFKYKWNASWRETSKQYYVQATLYKGIIDGKPRYTTTYLHIFLTDSPKDMVVDHIDNNSLNNRRSNLRVVSVKNNTRNRAKENSNSTTGVRNVSYSKHENKYIVQLQINGRNTVLGKFDDLKKAEQCAIEGRKKHYESKLN